MSDHPQIAEDQTAAAIARSRDHFIACVFEPHRPRPEHPILCGYPENRRPTDHAHAIPPWGWHHWGLAYLEACYAATTGDEARLEPDERFKAHDYYPEQERLP